ncbi:MAG TPA: diguanylate cyclase [Candidatus Cloacimonadota bacterium]|nr:diguanylate cyclase [Candidatus Cloacimonadota bacterium]
MNIIPFETMMRELLGNRSVEENLNVIIKNMEEEFTFSSLGVFLKVPNMEMYGFKIGRNLSSNFSKNTIYTIADPLIEELASFNLLEMKYPGRYLFETDYSHLLIAPLYIDDKLLGFLFMDKKEEVFEQSEIIKFRAYAALMSLVREIDILQNDPEHNTDLFAYFRVYNRLSFLQQIGVIFPMTKRYNRYLSLIIVQIANFKKLLRSNGELKAEKMVEAICASFQSDLRESDLVGKMAKDQIAILLPETSGNNAVITANRIMTKIKDIELVKSCKIGWGISTSIETTESIEEMYKSAEAAAKESYGKKKSQIILY